MILSQIVACSENFVIGSDNKLIWHFPEDLKFFKEKTLNKIMIMGRKTYDSLGKPLPKRFHIVISRTAQTSEHEQVVFVKTIDEALVVAQKKINTEKANEEVMVVGGAEIYKQTLNLCDRLYVTRIPGNFSGDTFYPSHFSENFKLTESTESKETQSLLFQVWEK